MFSHCCATLNRQNQERHNSQQVDISILKAILFIPENVFQSIHTSSSVAKNIIKHQIL